MLNAKINEAGFTEERPIIRNINIENQGRSVTLILGESGSGKTTFLLTITGILKFLLNGYVKGEVRLRGLNPLEERDYLKLPFEIGFVMQDPEKQLVMPTPLDEAVFTLQMRGLDEDEAVKKAHYLLSQAGLLDKRNLHVENLSGGEKRKLSILLSIVHNPPFLILDEPSSSLDVEGIKLIRKLIRDYKSRDDSTVLITEHKPVLFMDLIDKAYLLERGSSKQVSIDSLLKSSFVDITPHECVDFRNDENGEMVLETSSLEIGFEKPLLRDVNLVAREGEVIALLGPNGSGKTTFLKTLAGFYRPLSGEIKIGSSARPFYVPQFPDLLFLFKNVEKELVETSRKADLSFNQLVELIPWYPSVRSLNPHWLSHGQRRWLSIIIGYAYSRKIILLDEPTTGLDYVRFNHLKRLIRELKTKGVTFIISTHDPRLVAELADRVYVIRGQHLFEDDKCRVVENYYRELGVVT
ncbi:MAG: ATP-binding cassette domain-containing protein [Thermosphaera sp.]